MIGESKQTNVSCSPCVPLEVFRASRHDAVGKCPAAASASAAACRDLQFVT